MVNMVLFRVAKKKERKVIKNSNFKNLIFDNIQNELLEEKKKNNNNLVL